MKNKGISLIVLIITCVVIIVLATAIIVNIAQTNIINNSKEAIVKQDFKTMQDELTLYKSDKYVDTLGKFKAEELNVAENADIIKIIPSLKGTKYEEYVVIEKGKIAISEEMPDPDKTWALEALGEIKTTTNRPVADKIAPTAPTSIELTVVENKIVAVANGATDDKGSVTYEYSLDKISWQDSGEFANLESGKEYIVYARAIDGTGNKSEIAEEKVTIGQKNILVLYDKGNQCEEVTGGWKGYYSEGNNSSIGKCEFAEDSIKLETWGTWCRYVLETNNSIDFSNVNKIYVDCKIYNLNNSYASVGIGTTADVHVLYQNNSAGYEFSGVLELDANKLTTLQSNLSIQAANCGNIQINKVWLKYYTEGDLDQPTINLTKENITEEKVKITAEVDCGIQGISQVKWMYGNKTVEDFKSENTNDLQKESEGIYSFEVSDVGYYTVYVEGNNGNTAVSAISTRDKAIILYDKGNQCEDITGGWKGMYTGGTNTSVGRATFEEESVKLETWGTWCSYGMVTNNKIDLSTVTKMYVDCVIYNGSHVNLSVEIGNSDSHAALYKETTANYNYEGVLELDLSKLGTLNSDIFIAVSNTGNIQINKIWLE